MKQLDPTKDEDLEWDQTDVQGIIKRWITKSSTLSGIGYRHFPTKACRTRCQTLWAQILKHRITTFLHLTRNWSH